MEWESSFALKKSEEKFRTLAENAPDIITRYDREGRHLYVNAGTEEVLGRSRESILGKTNRELGYPPNLVDFWQKNIDEVFSNKEKKVFEYTVPTAYGEKHLEFHLVPEWDENGEVSSVLGIARDITHFKKAQHKIQELNSRLRKKAEDLEIINQELESFSYSVSHDLRAPLRTIEGFADALKEDFSQDLPREAQDYIRRLSRAGNRMRELIDSLLQLSRVSRKEIETDLVDLSRMARKFSSELKKSNPQRNAEFVIEKGLKIQGDPDLMGIVLQNLFQNAWKFTKDRSPARIEFGAQNKKEEKVFYVKDNGVGFDPSYSHKLFVPFQRLHSTSDFRGTGIGLNTVQRIIRKHNGKIWAESEEGKGATFYFTVNVPGD